ncbi:hypothetical protein CASFOL_037861 [Castilleja foliolosa]|uniref:Uncharacterized protein n=1 Tax=Castilleja foliolosa TaxID=1961234 RepID=A0ABD3BJE4_9LAMI
MGNVALCVPTNGEMKILSTTDSRLSIYRKAPVKAADIMLQNPDQFLCESNNLKIGHRITCIGADEELEKGMFYYLLPMEMLYSVLTNEEMKSLTQKASKGTRNVSAIKFSKIFPDQLSCFFSNSNNGSGIIKADDEDCDCEEINRSVRWSRPRSWEPALETIIETPPHG